MKLEQRVFETAVRVVDEAARIIEITGTDDSPDRHNTVILPRGWDWDNYRKNPVFLWSHNADPAVSGMPIGRVVKTDVQEFTRGADPAKHERVVYHVQFPPEGTYPFADLAYKMYRSGFLKAASVGFRTLKQRRLDPGDEKDAALIKQYGLDAKGYPPAILEKNEHLELSAVPIGSNPNALAKALREAVEEQHRGLLDAVSEDVVDEDWIAARFEALREVLKPVAEPLCEGTPSAEEVAELVACADGTERMIKKVGSEYCVFTTDGSKKIACHPTKEAAVKQLQAIEAHKHDKAAPISDEAVAALSAAIIKSVTEFIKAELAPINRALADLTELVSETGGERVAGDEPEARVEPSHLDVILAESVEHLERIASLVQ